MAIVPTGYTTWREIINQIKALLGQKGSTDTTKPSYIGDTNIVDAIWRAMCMAILWSPVELLEEVNFYKSSSVQLSGGVGTLPITTLRVVNVLIDTKYAPPLDYNELQARRYRYPNDTTDPLFAKLGNALYTIPSTATQALCDIIVKPNKWQDSGDDGLYIELPVALEPAMIEKALYYIRMRDEQSVDKAQVHNNNFKELISDLYVLLGKTPPKTIGETRTE